MRALKTLLAVLLLAAALPAPAQYLNYSQQGQAGGGGGGSGCVPAGSSGQLLSDNGAGACNSNPTAAGVLTFLGTPSGANLATALTTALPATKGGTGLTALGTGVATALGVNIGSAGAPVLFNGAGGTPSSLVGTNITGTAAGLTAGTVTTNANLTGDVTSSGNATTLAAGSASNLNSGTLAAARGGAGTINGALKGNGSGVVSQAACADLSNGTALCSTTPGTGVATFLATPSSANLATALTDETGSGAAVFGTSPTLVTPTLGVASATSVAVTGSGVPANGLYLPSANDVALSANTTKVLDCTSTACTFATTVSASNLAPLSGSLTNTGVIYTDGTNVVSGAATTANSVLLGGASGPKTVAGIITDGTSVVTLGVNTTTAGKVKLFGGTSGDATIQTASAAGTSTVVTLPNASSTLPIFGQQLTFSGPTAARTVTFPDAAFTAARSDAANTFTGVQTFSSAPVLSTGTLTNSGTVTFFTASDTVVGRATTDTLTNKRVTKRAPTITQSATPTINTDSTDYAEITGLAQDITSMTTNLSGTPVKGDTLWISITGTAARAITWGTSFEASTVALPTTTVTTNRLDVGFTWNVATSKWRCIAVA